MTLFFDAVRLLAMVLVGSASLSADRGLATRFGDPGDLLAGKELSCTRQKMAPGQLVCAHRTLPCGTIVVVKNRRNRRMALCEVLDRGPWGAILPTGNWGLKLHRNQPGDWRGIIDLSPAVAKALAFNGREHVQLFYQRVAQHLRVGRSGPGAR
jgi:rare lipoprotein A (peptidoglycan hydrolase)